MTFWNYPKSFKQWYLKQNFKRYFSEEKCGGCTEGINKWSASQPAAPACHMLRLSLTIASGPEGWGTDLLLWQSKSELLQKWANGLVRPSHHPPKAEHLLFLELAFLLFPGHWCGHWEGKPSSLHPYFRWVYFWYFISNKVHTPKERKKISVNLTI